MALAADVVWEVQTGGNDANGGGFDAVSGTPGTNATYPTSSPVAYTDIVIDGAVNTNCTSAATPFSSTDVGNVINITSGTGFTVQRVQVMSVAAAVATCDKSLGTLGSTGGTGTLGGALGSPGMLSTVMTVSGMDAHVKGPTYTLTTTTPGTLGPISLTVDITLRVEGYETTRGDLGAKPVLDVGAQTSFSVVVINGTFVGNELQLVRNLKVDGQDGAGIIGFDNSGGLYPGENLFLDCEALDCVTGFSGFGGIRCLSDGGTTGFSLTSNTCACRSCEARNATGNGFILSGGGTQAVNCLSRDNNVGFSIGAGFTVISCINCTAEGNSNHGFDFGYGMIITVNCLATNNGGKGFDTVSDVQPLIGCSGYNNTSGNVGHTSKYYDFLDLSGDPYVAVGSDDYRPNNTAGAGASLRGSGIGVASQTTNRDRGAIQHTDPAPLITTRRNAMIGR